MRNMWGQLPYAVKNKKYKIKHSTTSSCMCRSLNSQMSYLIRVTQTMECIHEIVSGVVDPAQSAQARTANLKLDNRIYCNYIFRRFKSFNSRKLVYVPIWVHVSTFMWCTCSVKILSFINQRRRDILYQPANTYYQWSRTMGHSGGDSTPRISLRLRVERMLLAVIFPKHLGNLQVQSLQLHLTTIAQLGEQHDMQNVSSLDTNSKLFICKWTCRSQVRVLLVVFSERRKATDKQNML